MRLQTKQKFSQFIGRPVPCDSCIVLLNLGQVANKEAGVLPILKSWTIERARDTLVVDIVVFDDKYPAHICDIVHLQWK